MPVAECFCVTAWRWRSCLRAHLQAVMRKIIESTKAATQKVRGDSVARCSCKALF